MVLLLQKKSWDWNELIINNIFLFTFVLNIANDDNDPDSKTAEECQYRNDWPK